CNAGLSRGGENARNRAFHRIVEISVVENNVGRLATELQRDAFEVPGGSFINFAAADLTAGECDLANERVRCQRLARFVAVTSDCVDDPWGKIRFFEQADEFEDRSGGEFRRFDYSGIASRQGRRQLPGQ